MTKGNNQLRNGFKTCSADIVPAEVGRRDARAPDFETALKRKRD
jgi:hypothetical protein